MVKENRKEYAPPKVTVKKFDEDVVYTDIIAGSGTHDDKDDEAGGWEDFDYL